MSKFPILKRLTVQKESTANLSTLFSICLVQTNAYSVEIQAGNLAKSFGHCQLVKDFVFPKGGFGPPGCRVFKRLTFAEMVGKFADGSTHLSQNFVQVIGTEHQLKCQEFRAGNDNHIDGNGNVLMMGVKQIFKAQTKKPTRCGCEQWHCRESGHETRVLKEFPRWMCHVVGVRNL